MSVEPVDDDYEPEDVEIPDAPDDEAGLVESLEWHLNRARWYRRKIARQAAQRDAMIARYNDWFQQTTAGWDRRASESEAWIDYRVSVEVERHPDGPKTFRLPSGTIRSVAGRPTVKVDDAEAFRLWVTGRDDVELLSRWKCEPNKDAVRQVLEDGEIVDGVHLEPGVRHVSVSNDEIGGF